MYGVNANLDWLFCIIQLDNVYLQFEVLPCMLLFQLSDGAPIETAVVISFGLPLTVVNSPPRILTSTVRIYFKAQRVNSGSVPNRVTVLVR
jgi:hypothetical protein